MAKRKRRPTQPGDFEDPLSNYDPPVYADELERALSEATVGTMRIRPFTTVPPDTLISKAIAIMAENDFFGLMVVENDRLVGIFSERDVLDKIAENFEATKNRPISDFMTPDPRCVYETASPAQALNLMAVGDFRRVPVLGVDDQVVGIIGPKRVTTFLEEFIH